MIKMVSNQINQELVYGTKEYIKAKLENIEEVYVSYLSDSGMKMMFWIVDKETNRLEKIWVNPDLKDKPSSFGKSGLKHSWAYCFKCEGYGLDRAHWALYGLYRWFGKDLQDMPRIERLN